MTVLETCTAPTELQNVLQKRLEPKKDGDTRMDYGAVAVCCLATRGYSVNHRSLAGVSDKDMFKVWTTLESAKISSSPSLGSWIGDCVFFRSREGCSLALGCNTPASVEMGPGDWPTIKRGGGPVLLDSRRVDGVVRISCTIRGAMAADTKLLASIRYCHDPCPPELVEKL